MKRTKRQIEAAMERQELCVAGYDPYRDAKGYRFDEAAAEKAVGFFSHCLRHVRGVMANQDFMLEDWQAAIVGNLFGWRKGKTGPRRYREAFIFVPRKNGKTTLAAGMVNLVMFTDDEPGAEIYSAAADRDQARLVFEVVRGMVSADEDLKRMAKIYRNAIVIEDSMTSYKPISSEANTKHGYNPHFVVIDELHAHKTPDLVRALLTGIGARRQPMVVHITTADYDRESICNSKYDYACKVRDGIIDDPRFFPAIFEAPKDADWTAEDTWRRANPNLGVSLSLDYLKRKCAEAQEVPAEENIFRRFHLNQRTEQDARFVQMAKWDACDDPPGDLTGKRCFGGLDLASTTDVAACVLLFPDDDGAYDVLPHFWIPSDNAHKRERRDRVPYITWAKQGLVTMTEGDTIDYATIEADLLAMGQKYSIVDIGADRWNLEAIRQKVAEAGVELIPFGQGFASMSAPSKELERLILAGKLRHGGHPVLRWMASNVAVRTDPAGNIKPVKPLHGSALKIDGIVALIMAIGRAMGDEGPTRSVYEDRGVMVV